MIRKVTNIYYVAVLFQKNKNVGAPRTPVQANTTKY